MIPNIFRKLFSHKPSKEEMILQIELARIKATIDRAGAKIERSINTIDGEEERRYLCLVKNKEACNADPS